MKQGQNFVKYFVRLSGNGVSRKIGFDIYWPLIASNYKWIISGRWWTKILWPSQNIWTLKWWAKGTFWKLLTCTEFQDFFFQNCLLTFFFHFQMRDKYLHTNCLAALANMSNQFKNLHPYVCQRILSLFEALSKRYYRLVATLQGKKNKFSNFYFYYSNNVVDL